MSDKRQAGFQPRKLTPELVLAAKSHIEGGVDLETASALVGVSLETMKAWLKDGAARQEAEPEVGIEEWVERGFYTPALNIAVNLAYAGAI